MKPAPLLLAGSILANVALVGVLLLRHPATTVPPPAATTAAAPATTPDAIAAAKKISDFQAALASGDAAALTAAGCPPEMLRDLAVGRAFNRLQAAMRALRPPPAADGKYWRRNAVESGNLSREARIESQNAMRDFSEAVRVAFGEDIESMFNGRDSRYSFLPAAKAEQLRSIERDYAEMETSYQNDIPLPSDREKLKLLRAEKERDIAAALTPAERAAFELHASDTANNVRNRLGDVLQSEDDYKKIFALQKAFDDRYANPDVFAGGPPSPEFARERRDAELKLAEDIRTTLGPDKWAAAQRANDQDYKAVTALAKRLNLPASATDTVLAARDTYANASLAINANLALPLPERRTQLQALATRAQTELQATLGTEGAQAFAQRSQWINQLKNGQAFSTNPKDAPPGTNILYSSIYTVAPPRPNVPPPPPGK